MGRAGAQGEGIQWQRATSGRYRQTQIGWQSDVAALPIELPLLVQAFKFLLQVCRVLAGAQEEDAVGLETKVEERFLNLLQGSLAKETRKWKYLSTRRKQLNRGRPCLCCPYSEERT